MNQVPQANESALFDGISLKNLVCRYNQCAPDWGETNCRYTYCKFYYIMNGEGEISIGQDLFHLQPEQLYLIPANTVHTYRHNPDRPIIKYWCHFQLTLGEEKSIAYHPETLMCELPGSLGIPVFQRLIRAAGSGDLLDTLEVNAALLQLLRLFLARIDVAAILPVSEDDIASQLKKYIAKNIRTRITLNQLAGIAHLHPNYLIKYFRKNFAESPIVYINNLRLQLATLQLIQNPLKPIKNIVQDVGFNDFHYFTRLFKKKYGITPSSYRSTSYHGLQNR